MGNCSKIVLGKEPFKRFGLSTKRVFDDAYLHLKEVNDIYNRHKNDLTRENADLTEPIPLPPNYYQEASQRWSNIYNH